MDRSDVCFLVKEVITVGDNGIRHIDKERKEVYCDVRSVSMTEYSQAGQLGIKPLLMFEMFRYDYDNQEIVEYENEEYAVYRVYMKKNDDVQLYVQKRAGVSNAKNKP